ncbi:hypothetical protein [Streptomyces sp. MBT62]|uniref:hypothetical protein n=1 Tax=Streptomyces sp. MBT62 TaxID=2800410 RepID=UPI00190A52E7|nr:hypothetical protein [Streptomyces sp. MBT62]MBK3568242.1 hypothetical protein [Streptomyces sp. MBT62]
MAHEVPELRRRGPYRRSLLDVGVGQNEPAGHGLQRVHRRVRVSDRLAVEDRFAGLLVLLYAQPLTTAAACR